MLLPLLQIVAITIAAICFSGWRTAMRRRHAQSWDAIVARKHERDARRKMASHARRSRLVDHL